MSPSSSKKRKRVKVRPRTRLQRILLRFGWLLPIGALLVGSGILVLTYAFASIPLPQDVKLTSSAEVYDVHGRLIGTYSDEITRFLIDTDELPKYIGRAVIAAEDRDFYKHDGVSFRGIVRAAWANLTGGEIQQGGSTITQQYVKIAVLQDPSRTVTRKAKEAILSIKLERRHSKREILGFYLNTIYLGRGAYGFEAAARTYFDKHAEDLTLKEAAYLAGIIPAPERYQPDDNQIGARDRRNRVLRLMEEQGYISSQKAARASRGKVKILGDSHHPKSQNAAHFMEWLRKNYLYKEFKEELYTRGFKIYTTLDLTMQEQAEDAIAAILNQPNDPQAALVSMTPRGEVRAFVGAARDFNNVRKARGFNYASDPPGRSAGSAFKPFTLLTALDEGISPQSRFSGSGSVSIDEPECMGDEDNDGDLDPWEPENFGGGSYGTMDLYDATANSVNTIYAQLIAEVGAEKVRDLVEEFGFAPKYGDERVTVSCSLSLGTYPVTPVEMARAYAALAGRGRLPEVTPILYITDSEGNCIREYQPRKGNCRDERNARGEQVVEQNVADTANDILQGVVTGGTATVANIGRPVAGKTGTAQDFKDAWFAGYIPQLATVVWEGYPLEYVKAEPGTTLSDGTNTYVVPKSGRISVTPIMTYCSDTRLCRPVHGYEVTGGGAPVSPAVIWANYMRETTAEMEVLPFPEPTPIEGEEIINEAPPAPAPAPAPVETAEPTEEPSSEPTEEPPPSEPPPSGPPSEPPPVPTESPGGGGDEGGSEGGDGGSGEGGTEDSGDGTAPVVLGVIALWIPVATVTRRRALRR